MVSNNTSHAQLLPNGLGDILPAETSKRRYIINAIMDSFARFGCADVSPPLVEYEDSLLAAGPGAALADNTFRLMDPVTRRMLALRSDMTAQIARIASSRLAHQPRPLRLSYTGQVMRINPDPVNPERQLVQIGAELIGASTIKHDAEVAVMALESLYQAGITSLSIDLNVPRLLDVILHDDDSDTQTALALRHAVSIKDSQAAGGLNHPQASLIKALLEMPLNAVSEMKAHIDRLDKSISPSAQDMLNDLVDLAALISASAPYVSVTIDPLERRGFDYHQGIGYSILASGVRGELGRGGRYQTLSPQGAATEVSTGVTLYLERLLQAAPALPQPDKLYLKKDQGLDIMVALTREGYHITIGDADPNDHAACLEEAKTCGATHIYSSQGITTI
ncbi:MAG TPA: ATP phosphoribosyltransferase regulatory subunit [Alphaproteobacteria bacterium]|nr:ATP phosphoribosyltransferase regulatory subunit [Alphaproteobacteria bacterium]